MTTPVRKVITRSKKTLRVKYPSAKYKRTMIRCESPLERDTLRFLEISPWVRAIYAQPSMEIYYDDTGEPRRYVPDFEVHLIDDSIVHIEVKPEAKLNNPKVKEKLESVARRYEELGRCFRIFTEKDVRCEPLHSNLKLLSYHSRSSINGAALKAMQQKLHKAAFRTIEDAAELIGGEQNVYRLIANGFLGANFNLAIGRSSQIWLRDMEDGDDSLRI